MRGNEDTSKGNKTGRGYGKGFQEQHREEYRTAAAIETRQSNLLSIIIICYIIYYRIVLLASGQKWV